MKTFSYVSMADLLQELPGITEEIILELAAENRIPQPIGPDSEAGITEEGELLFPSVTRDIIRATSRKVLLVERGGLEIDLEDLVSIAINNDVLPFYAGLWLELNEYDEFSGVVHAKIMILEGLHRPLVFEDLRPLCAAQHRVYKLIDIAENTMNPAVLNAAGRDELEEAVELMKSALPRVPLQGRLNAERKIRAAERRLAQLAN